VCQKVKEAYNTHLATIGANLDGLKSFCDILTTTKNFEVKMDIEQQQVNQSLKVKIDEISKQLVLQCQNEDLDLINSRVLGNPIPEV
jgi:hypothetical protein